MTIEPLPRAALGDAVAGVLRDEIFGGSFKPGQPLHENALSRQFSVSRSPVREALGQLEREGLVVSRPNRPATVRSPSPDEIRQTYTLRSALEGVAARWAAENATPQLVSDLRRKAEDLNAAVMARTGGPDPGLVGLAVGFHLAIADASGSADLRRMLRGLCNQIRLVTIAGLASLTGRRAEEIHAEHLGLIEAIAGHDGDRAERLAAAHVRGARDRLVQRDAPAR